jgi:MoxR-like ATPase
MEENVNNGQNIDDLISRLETVLKAKKNLILQGAPGTGKTYIAKKIAKKTIVKRRIIAKRIARRIAKSKTVFV